MMADHTVHPASYRDPSGFVFRSGPLVYRQVNQPYADEYELLKSSGLYEQLTGKGLLIAHTEIDEDMTGIPGWYKTLLPRQLSFISYPGEWSPAQLKDAALLTLQIMRIATGHGMILKDATPLNIQFQDGRPLFIDTLSFDRYDPSKPWIAYRQFCEQFLFPLYLHHYRQTGVHVIATAWPDGIPAALTARLLPFKSRFRLGVWLHVLLQGQVQEHHARKAVPSPKQDAGPGGNPPAFNCEKLRHLVSNLEDIIRTLHSREEKPSSWNDYYGSTILSQDYLRAKETIFREYIRDLPFQTALDLGANDGYFSRILAEKNTALVIAADSDWQCINRLYRQTREEGLKTIIPLCIDLAHPTPATGFGNAEQSTFASRAAAELVTALALVHHLVIGRNIPLHKVAAWLVSVTRVWLVIEFVPLEDEKTKELIRNKDHFHTPYDRGSFEEAFGAWFSIQRRSVIPGTQRALYLMKKK